MQIRKRDDYIMADTIEKKNINVDIRIKDKTTNPTPNKELLEALKEVEEMINNPEKYPRYNNWKELKETLVKENII